MTSVPAELNGSRNVKAKVQVAARENNELELHQQAGGNIEGLAEGAGEEPKGFIEDALNDTET